MTSCSLKVPLSLNQPTLSRRTFVFLMNGCFCFATDSAVLAKRLAQTRVSEMTQFCVEWDVALTGRRVRCRCRYAGGDHCAQQLLGLGIVC